MNEIHLHWVKLFQLSSCSRKNPLFGRVVPRNAWGVKKVSTISSPPVYAHFLPSLRFPHLQVLTEDAPGCSEQCPHNIWGVCVHIGEDSLSNTFASTLLYTFCRLSLEVCTYTSVHFWRGSIGSVYIHFGTLLKGFIRKCIHTLWYTFEGIH